MLYVSVAINLSMQELRKRGRRWSSLPCMVNKPTLDTQELGGEVKTAILSIIGLAQGYIMRGENQQWLVTPPCMQRNREVTYT